MKRACILLGLLLFGISFTLSAAETIPAGKETIEFKVPLGTVTFQHKTHATTRNIDCVTCHHTNKAGEPIKACGTCHGKAAEGKKPNLQMAVHTTCNNCHKAEIAKGKKAPDPTKCMQCHVKAKPA